MYNSVVGDLAFIQYIFTEHSVFSIHPSFEKGTFLRQGFFPFLKGLDILLNRSISGIE